MRDWWSNIILSCKTNSNLGLGGRSWGTIILSQEQTEQSRTILLFSKKKDFLKHLFSGRASFLKLDHQLKKLWRYKWSRIKRVGPGQSINYRIISIRNMDDCSSKLLYVRKMLLLKGWPRRRSPSRRKKKVGNGRVGSKEFLIKSRVISLSQRKFPWDYWASDNHHKVSNLYPFGAHWTTENRDNGLCLLSPLLQIPT